MFVAISELAGPSVPSIGQEVSPELAIAIVFIVCGGPERRSNRALNQA